VIDLLSPALNGNKIDYFVLNNNNFIDTNKGIEFAVEVIKSNPNMKNFFWDYNQLESTGNVHSLLDAVCNNPSIDRIRLESCLGGDINGYEALCHLLASGKIFELLDFERNDIQTWDRTEIPIPDYITSNPPLKYLYLSSNELNNDDAILISQALKQNTNLKELRLWNNNISDIGKEALSKATYDPTSLNSVSDSNHSCAICDIGLLFDNSGTGTRGRKMYHLLSARHKEGSNVRYLNLELKGEDDEESTRSQSVGKYTRLFCLCSTPEICTPAIYNV